MTAKRPLISPRISPQGVLFFVEPGGRLVETRLTRKQLHELAISIEEQLPKIPREEPVQCVPTS
jgi:hypothetical protein